MGKPFVILLNTRYPHMSETEELRAYLEEQYHAPVVAVNCLALTEQEIKEIMKQVLLTFPVREISIHLPKWIDALGDEHKIRKSIYESVRNAAENISVLSDIKDVCAKFQPVNLFLMFTLPILTWAQERQKSKSLHRNVCSMTW